MASKSSNLRSQLEDLNITRDELDQIGEALKKEDFRKLLNNYFEEVTNPENQKIYENEITQLEKERGVDVTFIHPAAGYVIKTSVDGKKKAFINICQNENIGKPVAKRESGGARWSIPYSQAPPRDDFDKNKNFCVVYDVVFHPETIRMANSNKSFKQLVNDTALNAIEDSFKVVLDKKNLIYPKIPFKGMKRPTVIRKKSKCQPTPSEDSDQGIFDLPNYPYAEPPEEVVPKCSELPITKNESPYTVPKFIIKQRSNIEMQDFTNSMTSKMNAAIPSALVVEIDLPLIKSAVDVNLDVSEKCLSLSSEKPAKYKLDVSLPYAVVEGEGNAKFDSRTKKLVVTLSVKRRLSTPSLQQLSREDSGVDSESRSTESSSDDELLSKCDQQSMVEVLAENSKTVDESQANAYRTNSAERFLSSDISYSLPSYKCNTVDNQLAFTFHVRNVEPESVDHVFLVQSCGVHLKFKSIGAGCFPSHYAFCVKFPGQLTVDDDSLSIEVWDNNVIAQLRLIGCDNSTLTDYLCGKSEEELEKRAFDVPVAVLKQADEIKLADEKEDIKVEVLKNEKELKSLKVTHTTKSSAVQSANESVENKVQIDDKLSEKAVENELSASLSKTSISSPSSVETKCDEKSEKSVPDRRKEANKCDGTSGKSESDESKEANKCDGTSINSESDRRKEANKCDRTSSKLESDTRRGSKKCDEKSEKSESNERKGANECDETTVNSESDESKAVEKCDKIAEISEPVPILKCDGKGSPAKKCTFSDRPPLVHALSESYNDGAEKMKPRFRGILKVGRSLSESNVDDYHWSEDGGEGVEKVKKTVRFNNSISKHLFRRNSCILDQRKKNQRKSRNKKRAQQRRASESENSECETDKSDIDEIVAKMDDETTSETSETSETQSESDDGLKKTNQDEMSLSRRNPHKKGKKKSARKSASTAKLHFSNNLMFELDA